MAKRRSRYLQIVRGLRGAAAKAQTLSWMEGTRDVNYPERAGNRPPSLLVYVNPFRLPTKATARLEETVNSLRFAGVKAFMGDLVSEAAPADPEDIMIREGLLSPRVLIKTGVDAVGTQKISQITGLPYKDYGGEAVSVPFGMGATVDTPAAGYAAIRKRAKDASRRNQVTYVPGNYAR
jgi:hypothetical protein